MLGDRIEPRIQKELNDRKNALNRDYYGATLEDGLTYSFSEMIQKTTYVRLVSPLYKTKIEGTLIKEPNPTNRFLDQHYNDISGRGYVPPPGIVSVRTSYVGSGATINTVKEAQLELKLYSNEQYDEIIPRFVRIGTILYLEFGWSNPKIDIARYQVNPRNFIQREEELDIDGKPKISIDYKAASTFPDQFCLETSGNSDVFIGTVTNYDVKLNEMGGYDVNIDMKTSGHSMYFQGTGKDRYQSVPMLSSTTSGFADSLDERNGLILLSKIKMNIQEEFNLFDAFRFPVERRNKKGKAEESIGIQQASVYYVDAGKNNEMFTKLKEVFKNNNFAYEDLRPYDYETSDLTGGFVARSYNGDLIITASTDFSDLKIGDGTKVHAYYINYYVSVRYLEDNILSRLFGVADASGLLTQGIRSIYIPQENIDTLPRHDATGPDAKPYVFKSNKMLTHEQLIPSSFDDVLINTEATTAILSRSQTGLFESKGDFQEKSFREYSKKLSIILRDGLKFFDEVATQNSEDSNDKKPKNPYHRVGNMRSIYVNINVVQDAFLGSSNRNFCDRNWFPSLLPNNEVNTALDDDVWSYRESVSYFQDSETTFDKTACVGTLREGLDNLWSTIGANFHNFPNFEVGVNVHSPGFLSVYDVRHTGDDGIYEFETYSKNSIVKSLELSSKIPKNVELAATLGASAKRGDLTKILGGKHGGLSAELMQDIKIKDDDKIEEIFNPFLGISFGKSRYMLDTQLQASDVVGADTETGTFANTPAVIDPETNEPVSSTASDVIDKNPDIHLNYLFLQNDNDSEFSPSFQGIDPSYIKQNRSSTDLATDSGPKHADKNLRDTYPHLNEALANMSETMDKIFTLGDMNKIAIGPEEADGAEVRNVTDSANGYKITGLKIKDITREKGTVLVPEQLKQFITFQGEFKTISIGNSDNERTIPYLSMGTHSDYQSYLDYLIYKDTQNSLEELNSTISYFELTLTIDGISGILPGQAFTVSYLPDLIDRNFFFIVKNIEQSLGPDGWTTTIVGLQRRRNIPKPREKSNLPIVLGKRKEISVKLTRPLPKPPRPKIPVPSDEEDIADDLVLDDLDFEDFKLDPPPPPPRPKIPVPSDDAEFLPDEELVELDDSMFEDFSDFDKPPPPPGPFIPWQMVENETADIILQMSDGMAIIEPFENSPKQNVKLYPKGNPNSHPITFSLGVTDVLSEDEYNNLKAVYQENYGKDPTELLNRLYTPFSLTDSLNVTGASVSDLVGEWDKKGKLTCYVAKRETEDGQTIMDKITELSNILRNEVGNDPNRKEFLGMKSQNRYLDDVIRAILSQPERTKLTVIKQKKKNDETKIKIKPERKKPPIPTTPTPPPAADPPPAKPKPKPKKPKEPMGSFYGGLSWQNNLLYRVVPKWKTLGAASGKTNPTEADATRLLNNGTYFKDEVFFTEDGAREACPFKTVRQKFWDEMIEKPDYGGKKELSDKAKCQESERILTSQAEFNYLKELKGTKQGSGRWDARL